MVKRERQLEERLEEWQLEERQLEERRLEELLERPEVKPLEETLRLQADQDRLLVMARRLAVSLERLERLE